MKLFKTIHGENVDIVQHSLKLLGEYPIVNIHIGTDSQTLRGRTVYVTVIAYRYGTRGVHYIYTTEILPKIKDVWTRLWGETDRSVSLAQWFRTKINLPIEIDMDFNPDEYYDSYKLISASKGWASSLGYKCNIKPDNQIATKAADHQCRSVKLRRRRNK